MKKGLKVLFTTLAMAACLVGCGNVTQSYADKVNSAAATSTKDDDYTYAKCLKDLGDPAINLTATLFGSGESGACTWYDGCKTLDEYTEKHDAGKDVNYIVITFADGYAASASFGTSTGASSSAAN